MGCLVKLVVYCCRCGVEANFFIFFKKCNEVKQTDFFGGFLPFFVSLTCKLAIEGDKTIRNQ